ncbi:MAG: class I SAM-dependent methyltransferase [Thermoplasmata archaeon]|nr:class I SAM-dependent methyltransferase [Thermoplasmata archaeon]
MPDETLELWTDRERVRLRFVSEPPNIYLLASEPTATWPAAVLRAGRATLIQSGERTDGSASLVSDSIVRERVLRRFRDGAGAARADRWFGAPGPLIAIRPEAASARGDSYGRWVQAEFDSAAPEYAARLDRNPVERRFRIRSLEVLQGEFPRPGRLVELGGGSGAETIPMLRAGHRVVVIDVSRAMLNELEKNAARDSLGDALAARELRARDVGTLVREFGAGSFDGGFSTFGAMNLEPDLAPVVDGLGYLLRPGARFVAGVFNRRALVEPAAAALSGHPGRAIARRRRPSPVGSHRFSTDVYLRSIGEVRAAFATRFQLRAVFGLGLILPPPNLAAKLERWGVRWDRLDQWDRRVASRPPFVELADQFLAVFERSGRSE